MQEKDADFFIRNLHLQPHPEGGWFRETYRAAENIAAIALPLRFTGDRQFSTAIYYLLQRGDYSAFHRIRSDECWHWYAGGALLIHVIEENGNYYCIKLGNRISNGEVFQFVVPAMAWFASEPAPDSSFVLTGCTVAPGFDFSDFEMADQYKMQQAFPQYKDILSRLCR